MEKYNAETMAIVPREADDIVAEKVCMEVGFCGGIFESFNTALIKYAQQVEPVVPLSEVLELLEDGLKDMDVEDDFTDGFKSGFSLAHHLIKQKYGVSE